jgi:hypothetical protein
MKQPLFKIEGITVLHDVRRPVSRGPSTRFMGRRWFSARHRFASFHPSQQASCHPKQPEQDTNFFIIDRFLVLYVAECCVQDRFHYYLAFSVNSGLAFDRSRTLMPAGHISPPPDRLSRAQILTWWYGGWRVSLCSWNTRCIFSRRRDGPASGWHAWLSRSTRGRTNARIGAAAVCWGCPNVIILVLPRCGVPVGV